MNKTAIKNFAIWARNKLIADIKYKAGLLGITEKTIKSPLPQSTNDVQFFDIGTKEPYSIDRIELEQRDKLVAAITNKAQQSDYPTAYQAVIEEVAYTWFNRLIAVRFMEVNDYLPSRIRVLSSESAGKNEPDLVTNPFDTNLDFTPYEKDRIVQLKNDNQLDELFRMLFIKQCNALNVILPNLFEKTCDYTELLLNVPFTDKDGVVYHLVQDIPEDDFKEAVEIIGWMYQYYNEERKNTVINIYKGKVKKEDIPAATQLFTTDWVVRYMVDNSLGRYWIERNPQSKLYEKLNFFVTPQSGEFAYLDEKVEPKDLTFFDPCMGSGHILIYAFDVLMEIYRECGYSDRDASICILKDNLYGLDIDDRAYQLAYFAVMMKARSYNRRVLALDISPHVCAIQESNGLEIFTQDGITTDKLQNVIGEYLIKQYRHAKEIGSLQTIEEKDYNAFKGYLLDCEKMVPMDLFLSAQFNHIVTIMSNLVDQAEIMSKKYAVVCTNPPYMNKLESHLKEFILNEYKLYSGDLFSVFMYRNFDYCKSNGYSAFMTPFVWMFIKTYEKLREFIINSKSITTLIQMEYSAFEEATVPICSFVLKNAKYMGNGYYFKLSNFKGGMEVQKQKVMEALADKRCGYFYENNSEKFSRIPGMPIAYWVSEEIIDIFAKEKRLEILAEPRKGLTSANDAEYLRLWSEVDFKKLCLTAGDCNEAKHSGKKWFPLNKGGSFRKWYGNNEYVINWEEDGVSIRNFKNAAIRNTKYYFRECISWNDITSKCVSFRYKSSGQIFNDAGPSIFGQHDLLIYLMGFCNSKVSQEICYLIAPTIHYGVGQIAKMPIKISNKDKKQIEAIVEQNITFSKIDWDSFETSWDFRTHPLAKNQFFADHADIPMKQWSSISVAYNAWKIFAELQFNQLKGNEEELNRSFINIYGLQNELTPAVEAENVTIRKVDLGRDIRSFLSYAVGCMFGRYSLDADGLTYAGGAWNESKYSTFIPNKDNILPITDEEYFEDDIVGLFVAFVKKVYSEETLEQNLDFIAKALGNKGNTSREIIRNYFMKDFFKDHCKIYQKRPIYWLFDSGKANGFKALIYMHRYDENTIGNLRIDYLHQMQRVYDREIARMQEIINNSTNAREVAIAEKRKEKLIKQLKETKDYDEKIAHLALVRIAIDLDDGVKVNYEKVQTGTDGKKLEVLAKI